MSYKAIGYEDFVHLKDKALVVDVRSPEQYEKEHIPGAVNLPLDQLEEKLDQLPRDKPIVVYCGSSRCTASLKAARLLSEKGFTNVYRYVGGLADWKARSS